jgi:FkbM family methyltransferase
VSIYLFAFLVAIGVFLGTREILLLSLFGTAYLRVYLSIAEIIFAVAAAISFLVWLARIRDTAIRSARAPHGACLFRSDGYNQLTDGRDGYFLYNRNDRYIGSAIAKYGEYSAFEMSLFEQICDVGHIVIEVGANLGAHTVGLARLVGSTGRVVAFEPQRLIFQTLCANIALNSLENVDCYWSAVARENGTITVPELTPHIANNFGGLSLGSANNGFRVPCVTLDEFVGLSRLDLVKIDVEGMEADVIRGAENLLRKFRPALYVENDRIEKSHDLIQLIISLGYRLYWHLPALYNRDNFRHDDEDIFAGKASCNMLCVHSDFDCAVTGLPEVLDVSYHPWRSPRADANQQK